MRKNILIGFICGTVLSISIYFLLFFFVYAPQKHFAAFSDYNRNIPMYETYLECKTCENQNKSAYECAVEVMRRNTLGRYADAETFLASEYQRVELLTQELTDRCATKSLEELKSDEQFFGREKSSSCDSRSYISGANEQCERDIQEACKQPRSFMLSIAQSQFVNQICLKSSAMSNFRQAEYLKRGETPPLPKIQDVYDNYLDVNGVMGSVLRKIFPYSGGHQPTLFGPILLFIMYFLIFILPPAVGITIGIFIERKKWKSMQKPPQNYIS
ncbi:MAG: hypothetical protein AAB581_01605 [Patescibacteria group bacterium]